MPMRKEKEALKKIHDEGAKQVEAYLNQGKQIAFLTIGDPSVYSTYLYIHRRVLRDGYEARIIPGVPSFCAAAAALNRGLAENRGGDSHFAGLVRNRRGTDASGDKDPDEGRKKDAGDQGYAPGKWGVVCDGGKLRNGGRTDL